MTRAELLAELRRHQHAVQASVDEAGRPQAALVGVAVTDDFEIVFDTLASTRKARNLRARPRAALVFGGDDDRTVQLEGPADFPQGEELARLKRDYFAAFPTGRERERWPDIAYVRIRATWIRDSDFSVDPPRITELDPRALGR